MILRLLESLFNGLFFWLIKTAHGNLLGAMTRPLQSFIVLIRKDHAALRIIKCSGMVIKKWEQYISYYMDF